MKKKILFIVQLPPPVHGASMMNQYLVNSSTIAREFETKVVNIVSAKSIESIGKFSIKKIFSFIRVFFHIRKTLIRFKPDIIYFTISPSGPAFYRDILYTALLKSFKRKLIFHLHGKGIHETGQKNWILRKICKRLFRHVFVIALSESLQKDVESFHSGKIYIVNNGIPLSAASVQPRKTEIVPLLFLSNYVRTKGIVDLVDAIEIVARSTRSFRLKLIGKSFDITSDWLKEYIKSKNIEDLIMVCGPRYDADKIKELTLAEIFIFPTYYRNEAFPIALLEAMQFELAIITTWEGGISDMIDDGITGLLVNQRDIQSLAEKILFLVNNREERIKLGKQARAKFVERYTLEVFERNMLSVFQQVLNHK